MTLPEIEQLVGRVEKFVLDAEKHPHGRTINWLRQRRRTRFVVRNMLKAYSALEGGFPIEEHELLYLRVFHLVRDFAPIKHCELGLHVDEESARAFWDIACFARADSLGHPKTEEERIEQGRLYKYNDGSVFAAQIRDPARGCSASVCSNCDEPIAFCDFQCPVCNYELIGAHGMGDDDRIENWRHYPVELKQAHMSWACQHTIDCIRQGGDWRGTNSPLNRYMERGKKWGGSSTRARGAPLRRQGVDF